MITAKGISKSFGALKVLRDIDVRLRDHAVTSIVGPSGAGKSTLLQILGTLTRPDAGKVFFDDTDVLALSERALSRFRNESVGFVFQAHRLLPEFSLAENVALPALIGGVSRAEAMTRARRLLAELGLGERAEHRPGELSGGEAQRGAVARALINGPRVILADEPSGSLDSANRRDLHRLFFDLRDSRGTTFVIVTHDERLASDSDVIISMADGRITDSRDNLS
ncbi:MAG: ABC transporter ATP-binding protein [Muribaculaceae bacterium]|nr:ABC transporter ATP-binding protein [Muribaculaceae bacterium]